MGPESREFGSFGTLAAFLVGEELARCGDQRPGKSVATVKMAWMRESTILISRQCMSVAERVIGLAFSGGLSDIKFTTKCLLGNVPPTKVYDF